MKDLFENKEEFYNIIMKEFFTKNSSSVIQELKHMEHYKPKMNSKRKG
jgi:hypothetical protein